MLLLTRRERQIWPTRLRRQCAGEYPHFTKSEHSSFTNLNCEQGRSVSAFEPRKRLVEEWSDGAAHPHLFHEGFRHLWIESASADLVDREFL